MMNASNSSNSAGGFSCPIHVETTATQVLKTLAYALIIILSLLGNSTVIYVVFNNHRARTMTNMFIANLAASDILITFTGMPNMITELYLRHWVFGPVICKLVVYLQSVSVAGSVLTLLAVTVDRFLSIVYPLRGRLAIGKAKYIIALIWLLSLSIMAPLIDAQKAKRFPNGLSYCIEEWNPPFDPEAAPKDFTVLLFVVMYVAPLLTMAVLYFAICRTLWIRKAPGTRIKQTETQLQRSRKRVLKMLLTVTLLFAACWLPLWIFQFIIFFSPQTFPCFNYAFYFSSLFLGHSNSAINPFLYSFFNVNFREGFRQTCRCCARRSNVIYPTAMRSARTDHHLNSVRVATVLRRKQVAPSTEQEHAPRLN